jgi:hypothetical protein
LLLLQRDDQQARVPALPPSAVQDGGSRCGWPGGGVAVPCQARRLCETPAVTGDERPAMRVSALFDPEPQTWGLRGDPYLWRAFRAHLAGQDIPASPGELASLLHQAFRELAGTDLASDPAASVYLEQYAHGGMSSGMISLEAWRQRLMPMLVERARTRLSGWPWITGPDHPVL